MQNGCDMMSHPLGEIFTDGRLPAAAFNAFTVARLPAPAESR